MRQAFYFIEMNLIISRFPINIISSKSSTQIINRVIKPSLEGSGSLKPCNSGDIVTFTVVNSQGIFFCMLLKNLSFNPWSKTY